MDTALLVIDVQESFRQRENWAAISNPEIIDRVGRLVRAARARGHLVVWVVHAEPGTGTPFDPVNGFVRVADGLSPSPEEPLITKTSFNAFTTTGLHRLLTSHGVREVVVCGIRTEQCCETTTRLACDLGYDVTFVTDATATFPIDPPGAPEGRSLAETLADPGTMSAEDVVRRTEYVLAGRFATIRTVAEVTAAPVATGV